MMDFKEFLRGYQQYKGSSHNIDCKVNIEFKSFGIDRYSKHYAIIDVHVLGSEGDFSLKETIMSDRRIYGGQSVELKDLQTKFMVK